MKYEIFAKYSVRSTGSLTRAVDLKENLREFLEVHLGVGAARVG